MKEISMNEKENNVDEGDKKENVEVCMDEKDDCG